MLLDQIIEMWKEDCIIDDNNLDIATMKCASYHSKYLELFSIAKLQLKRRQNEHNILKKNKWLYYNGKMTKKEMDDLGWAYDPFKGMSKPMKSDMELYYDTDPDLQKSNLQLDYQKNLIETLEEIMTTIRWRHSSIKNMISWKQFTAGI